MLQRLGCCRHRAQSAVKAVVQDQQPPDLELGNQSASVQDTYETAGPQEVDTGKLRADARRAPLVPLQTSSPRVFDAGSEFNQEEHLIVDIPNESQTVDPVNEEIGHEGEKDAVGPESCHSAVAEVAERPGTEVLTLSNCSSDHGTDEMATAEPVVQDKDGQVTVPDLCPTVTSLLRVDEVPGSSQPSMPQEPEAAETPPNNDEEHGNRDDDHKHRDDRDGERRGYERGGNSRSKYESYRDGRTHDRDRRQGRDREYESRRDYDSRRDRDYNDSRRDYDARRDYDSRRDRGYESSRRGDHSYHDRGYDRRGSHREYDSRRDHNRDRDREGNWDGDRRARSRSYQRSRSYRRR
eukprot:gnl/MRDRNA2_/MRDRNA2_28955_c0_seq1.p1 gnl/MRDRNA2_/MRDRNA2_28955_c0~~gnl/MRDRNA2_/MRDRNA2_28955_c0_seq1.p1  ORF type:complete len:352 (+),score=55.81 gnl/MRDRNA2_/MRDRNA2_28955_c0_seq1:99-1154(+)